MHLNYSDAHIWARVEPSKIATLALKPLILYTARHHTNQCILGQPISKQMRSLKASIEKKVCYITSYVANRHAHDCCLIYSEHQRRRFTIVIVLMHLCAVHAQTYVQKSINKR